MRRLTRLTAAMAFVGMAGTLAAQEEPCEGDCGAGESGEGCTSSSSSTTSYLVKVISQGPPVVQQTCATTRLTIVVSCPDKPASTSTYTAMSCS